MDFKATFKYSFNSPDEDVVPSREMDPVSYLVQTEDKKSAERYARRFEGLDLQYCEGIGHLISIESATAEEMDKLIPLTRLETLLAQSQGYHARVTTRLEASRPSGS